MLKFVLNERALPLIYTLQVTSLKHLLGHLAHFPYFRAGSTSNFSIKIIIEIIYFVFNLNYNTLITSLYYLPFKNP